MKRLTKAQVKKIIKERGAIEVGLVPCKANPHSIWISPIWITALSVSQLERDISHYEYYNCNSKVGNYPHYYIKEGK